MEWENADNESNCNPPGPADYFRLIRVELASICGKRRYSNSCNVFNVTPSPSRCKTSPLCIVPNLSHRIGG